MFWHALLSCSFSGLCWSWPACADMWRLVVASLKHIGIFMACRSLLDVAQITSAVSNASGFILKAFRPWISEGDGVFLWPRPEAELSRWRKHSWIFNDHMSQTLPGLWLVDSLSQIQSNLIPRILGCQSHTPFIFQSCLPSSSSLSVRAAGNFNGTSSALLHIALVKNLIDPALGRMWE